MTPFWSTLWWKNEPRGQGGSGRQPSQWRARPLPEQWRIQSAFGRTLSLAPADIDGTRAPCTRPSLCPPKNESGAPTSCTKAFAGTTMTTGWPANCRISPTCSSEGNNSAFPSEDCLAAASRQSPKEASAQTLTNNTETLAPNRRSGAGRIQNPVFNHFGHQVKTCSLALGHSTPQKFGLRSQRPQSAHGSTGSRGRKIQPCRENRMIPISLP